MKYINNCNITFFFILKVKSTMTSKRRSTSELNADNWQEEDEPEDAGNFIKAPADILKNRVFKSARRRVTTQPGEVICFLISYSQQHLNTCL